MIKVFLLALCTTSVWSLSCPECGTWPCDVPTCCASGEYTTDVCGCCLTCAKPQGDACGGPWRTSGSCARGFRCLRSCDCKAEGATPEEDKDCVFPFTWKKNGKTYNKCTKDESTNGKAWCATAVDGSNVARRGSLKDCGYGCPGTDFECGEDDLFNRDGLCVTAATARERSLLSKRYKDEGWYSTEVDEVFEDEAPITAEVCVKPGEDKLCKCGPPLAKLQGGTEGECHDPVDGDYGEPDFGFCFLENVQDPLKSSSDCYDDTEWSASRGMYYSRKACRDKIRPSY